MLEENARKLSSYLVEMVDKYRQAHGFTNAEVLRALDLAKLPFAKDSDVLIAFA